MSDKMREEFEAWAIADAAECGMDLEFEFDADADWYLGKSAKHLNLAWAAWQASRAAVVVELPQGFTYHGESSQTEYVLEAGAVAGAIEAVGLKVRP